MAKLNSVYSGCAHRWARIAAVLLLLAAACSPKPESEDVVPQRDIKTVMEAHVDSLMAMPDVVGVAITELDDGTPAIMVLVIAETDAVKKSIPAQIEGHPVKIVAGGEIRPLDSEG